MLRDLLPGAKQLYLSQSLRRHSYTLIYQLYTTFSALELLPEDPNSRLKIERIEYHAVTTTNRDLDWGGVLFYQ